VVFVSRLLLSALGVALLVAPSCSSDPPDDDGGDPRCESLFALQRDCPDYEADCVEGCTSGRERAEDNGCAGTFEALADCLEQAADVCESGCDAETAAYVDCTCPGGDCGTTGECAYATSGDEGFCTVLAICGETTLSLECNDEVECECLDGEGALAATVAYDSAFCTGAPGERGDAAASACGWP
jgi:hypothetical protein